MKRISLALLAAVCLGPLQAAADAGGAFSVYDADKDGSLDRDEYGRFLAGQPRHTREDPEFAMDHVDADGDGRVSGQEMVDALTAGLRKRLKR